jgi:glycogen debranching enzyme GlgX
MSAYLPTELDLGHFAPFGATVTSSGVNFAVFSQHAQRIEVCVFDTSGTRELKRYALHGPTDGVFHGHLPGVADGLVYGYRAHGPYAPEQGHRFNANKLLLDPYAKEIIGQFGWRAEHHGYELGHPNGARSFDTRDNAAHALKARVPAKATAAPRPASARKQRQLRETVLYEIHVAGFSKLHPSIPEAIRGTYAALAHPIAVNYFKQLGVTTLSLLPVHYWLDEPGLVDRGMSNYWGYNSLGFFSPDPGLSATPLDPRATIAEFKAMVDSLHANGIEVVLDVVYNHTAEGNEYGPTLSFRGLDNAAYYRLVADDRNHCENLTGCGNTFNVEHPRVTQLVLDSLRYWVQEMGVDGFRFDLAPVLGRKHHGFDQRASFFTALAQDPILADVHLIAEPWDAGFNGYQVGHFPGRWLEWNDKFRDATRAFWLQHHAPNAPAVSRGEMARRFTASSDVFDHSQRKPTASVNFISVHDGFTLNDVVSYSRKHNHANGEDNRDGRDNELCANFGAEGATTDAQILAARASAQRSMLATMLLAQGTPMLGAGDEFGRSQQGNNNAYCQRHNQVNTTSWFDWASAKPDLIDFTTRVLQLRHTQPLLRWPNWLAPHEDDLNASVRWLAPSGVEMQTHDWHDAGFHAFACLLMPPRKSDAISPVLILFNPHREAQRFTLPPLTGQGAWTVAIISGVETLSSIGTTQSTATMQVPACALVVMTRG